MSDWPLVVPARFRGPARSGNGGWSAGSLAERLGRAPGDHDRQWPAVEVRLTSPPPLDLAVDVVVDDEAATAVCSFGRAVVVPHEPFTVDPVTVEEAAAAESAYPGLRHHPFPTCFACGPGREPGDGLRIFPGRVADAPDGGQRVAATWRPDASTCEDPGAYDVPRASLPITWAAVDCAGGWAGDLEERPMVLGQMTCEVDTLPVVGETHVVVGQRLAVEGRRTTTAATLYDEAGRVVARAEHVWVDVDPEVFNRL